MAAVLACCAGAGSGVAAAQSGVAHWNAVEHVIAFADVHGAYPELHGLLSEAGVIDAQDHWAAGNRHVVSLGDLLDRGPDSRQVMDLLMRLQAEAQRSGGQLHVLLGNHEAMNLLGDLRYGSTADYATYADLEAPAEREAARKLWQGAQCSGPCPPFDQKFPPGYFGRRAAFSATGRYGQWLLGLPVAIMINDTLYVHGGLSQQLAGMSLEQLNTRYRAALTEYLGLAARLEQAGLLQAADEYDARAGLAAMRLAARTAPDAALGDTVQRFRAAADNPLLAEDGPNWYRGQALCNEATETDVLLPLLQQFGATRLVIGHTPTRDSRAVTRFGGRVVKLDTGMNRAAFRGRATALFVDASGLAVHYAGETGSVPLRPEGLYITPNEVDDDSVQAALREGEVAVTGPRGPNELNVTVSYGGRRIPAVFLVRGTDAVRAEVAAWRLDRLLQLGVVPATAERTVQGQRGVLQARPRKWLTEADVQKQGVRGGGWCAIAPQFQLLYALDVLTGNEVRSAASMVIDTDNWLAYGTTYAAAFGTARGLPAYLAARPPTPGPELRRRLRVLDEQGLETALGDLLDTRARRAILARRDTLLALPVANAAAGQ